MRRQNESQFSFYDDCPLATRQSAVCIFGFRAWLAREGDSCWVSVPVQLCAYGVSGQGGNKGKNNRPLLSALHVQIAGFRLFELCSCFIYCLKTNLIC